MRFHEMPDWREVKKDLAKNSSLDDETIESIGEQEGDSLDLVELVMSLEEAFPKHRGI